jgi:hypothetical protein
MRHNQVKTAYDYRRAIELVQLLAIGDTRPLEMIARYWQVELPQDYAGYDVTYLTVLLERLAQHALEHARQEDKS